MLKQYINKSIIPFRGNTILWGKSNGYYKEKKESNTAFQAAVLNWVYTFIYKVSKALYSTLKDGIVRVETINSNGHPKLVDIMSVEGYFMFPYNFLPTLQPLYLLPINKRGSATSLSLTNHFKIAPMAFTISVKHLEENCGKLVAEENNASKGNRTNM